MHFKYACFRLTLFYCTDGHSTEDIVYQWLPGEKEVLIGNNEMAQFEYKGSNLSSKIDVFTTG